MTKPLDLNQVLNATLEDLTGEAQIEARHSDPLADSAEGTIRRLLRMHHPARADLFSAQALQVMGDVLVNSLMYDDDLEFRLYELLAQDSASKASMLGRAQLQAAGGVHGASEFCELLQGIPRDRAQYSSELEFDDAAFSYLFEHNPMELARYLETPAKIRLVRALLYDRYQQFPTT